MFRLGIIEESLENMEILNILNPYFVSQRTEDVPEDECPLWHINEYHVADTKIQALANNLCKNIKSTWYIHAINEKELYVILKGRWFQLPLYKNDSWDSMIEYGVTIANVDRHFLETVPLHI